MNDAIQSPISAYITSDRNRSVILPLENGVLKLKIPSQELAPFWRLTRMNAAGEITKDVIKKSENIFETEVNAYELILIENTKKKSSEE